VVKQQNEGKRHRRIGVYIRWKDKPRTEQVFVWKWIGDTRYFSHREQKVHAMLYCAYLVESKRVNGKPRQTSIYLASIQDGQRENTFSRFVFWAHVQRKLETLHLTDEQMATLKKKVQERIPEVTDEQWQEYEKQSQEEIAEAFARLAHCR
jgi:hypothetical protein